MNITIKAGKNMKRKIFLLLCWLWIYPVEAQQLTDPKLFAVNLDEIPPDVEKLSDEYRFKRSQYNWKYEYRWDMPKQFDDEFADAIVNFGTVEKRIANEDEESILRWLKNLPPKYYPYIGPLLHTMRGLSGKVLDLPGIKETKNKFPNRIASVFEDVPDIEFASPAMYIYLMPEIWGEKSSIEYPQPQYEKLQNPHKTKINPEFVAKILQNVPQEKFALNYKPKPQNLGVRHYFANENTPLSGADVQAFVNTGAGLKNFIKENNNELRFIMLDSLVRYQDEKNGENSTVAFLKSAVNPCQTIARKVKWLKQYKAFQSAIGTQGFGLEDWAYICDKTVKAYRVYHMPIDYIGVINFTHKGGYEKALRRFGYSAEDLQTVHYHHAAFVQMYTSTSGDIDAVKPFAAELSQMFFDLGVQYGGTPLIMP